MSFQGYVAHFGSVIWEKNKSRPRPRTKQAKQAKHISQMGRRHRNNTLGAGACLREDFFLKQLIDVSIFEATDWSSKYKGIGFQVTTYWNDILSEWRIPFLGGWALIWDSYQTCRYNKMWPKMFCLNTTGLPVSKTSFIFSCKKSSDQAVGT